MSPHVLSGNSSIIFYYIFRYAAFGKNDSSSDTIILMWINVDIVATLHWGYCIHALLGGYNQTPWQYTFDLPYGYYYFHVCLTLRSRLWGRDTISQETLSNALSWMKILKFQLKCMWSFFPKGALGSNEYCINMIYSQNTSIFVSFMKHDEPQPVYMHVFSILGMLPVTPAVCLTSLIVIVIGNVTHTSGLAYNAYSSIWLR